MAAMRCVASVDGRRRDLAHFLLLGRHDALERRVAQLVDPALDRQQRRQRQRHPLEPAALELALHAQARLPRACRRVGACTSMMIVACGMPSFSASTTPTWPKPWSSDCRPVSTRSNCSSRIAAASASATVNASALAEAVGLDVDGAVGAARERLANHLRGARGPGRADHDLAAVLLLEAQRLFERVGVGLVQLEAGVLVANPRLRLVHPRAATRA